MTPTAVQSAAGSSSTDPFDLVLPSAPTVGNLLVLVATQYGMAAGYPDTSSTPEDGSWFWQGQYSIDNTYYDSGWHGYRASIPIMTRRVAAADDLTALRTVSLTPPSVVYDVGAPEMAAVLIEISGIPQGDYGNYMVFANEVDAGTAISQDTKKLNLTGLYVAGVVGFASTQTFTMDADFAAGAESATAPGVAVQVGILPGGDPAVPPATNMVGLSWDVTADAAGALILWIPDYTGTGWDYVVGGDVWVSFTGSLIKDMGEYVGPWPLPHPTQALLESDPAARELDYFVGVAPDDALERHTFKYDHYADPAHPIFDSYSSWDTFPPATGDTPSGDYWLTSIDFGTSDPASESDPKPLGAHLICAWYPDWSADYVAPPRPNITPADMVPSGWTRTFGLYPVAGATATYVAMGQPEHLDLVAGATVITLSGSATGSASSGGLDPVAGATSSVIGILTGDIDLSSNEPITLGLSLRGTARVDDLNDPEATDGSVGP